MYYVYIIYSGKFDRYYIGQTDSLEARLDRHNSEMVRATKHYLPWELVYYEEFETRGDAMKRERFLKRQRNRELYRRLIDSFNGRVPSTRD